ncbi:MAG: TonB-dependent receptor [Chthoniobacter sp.]
MAGRDDVNFTRWGVAPSLAFGLGTPTQLTLSYLHLQQNNMPDFGVPWVTATNNALKSNRNQAAPVSFSNYYGLNQRDREKLRSDEAIAILRHEFNEDASVRYTFHYGRNSRDSIISAPRFISDDSTDINREFQGRDEIDTVLTNQLDLNFNVATFGIQHAINVGFEYTYETFQNRLLSSPAAPLADLYFPDVNDDFPGTVTRTGAINNSDTNTLGAYLFDTMKFGEHWLLSGGVRGDYFDADYDMHDPAGVTTSFGRRDRMVSWRGALMYKPVPIGSIYFAAGSSFNPSAEDFALTEATAALAPEKTTTYELGTKWDVLDKRLSLTAAVFYTLKENARTPGLTASDPVTVLQGEQQVTGFEFEAKGHLTSKWEVIGGYTYLDSEIKKSNTPAEVGNELPGVPHNAVTFWTTYQLPWNLEVGLGAQWVDQRFANLINTRNAGSYYTIDAMLAYKVNENLTVRANVYNLTDEEYIGGLHIQGSFGHFIPGTGRTATITASLKF